MIENIGPFLEKLEKDRELQEKLREAELNYPGSTEIREPFLEETLLPVAREAGFEFTLEELRKYETRVKMTSLKDIEQNPDDPELPVFFLLDRGWETEEELFKQ